MSATGPGQSHSSSVGIAIFSPVWSLVGETFMMTKAYKQGRVLDVFTVVPHQASDGQRWYMSTAQLQLASLQYCQACRSVPSLYLTVGESTPERL